VGQSLGNALLDEAQTSGSTPVNAAKVAEYRRLRFDSIEEALKEVDRILAAEKAGTLRRSGNWSAGQVFNHIAVWMNFAFDGFPKKAHPPFFVRWILKMKVKGYIRDGMPRGVRIPGIPGGTLGTEDISTEEGARKLREALVRLKNEPVKFHSPAFGVLDEESRIALQLRHMEGHMGYLHP